MSSWRELAAAAAVTLLLAEAAEAGPKKLGLGQLATPEAIAGWDIDVRPDGHGLPPGRGTARQGEALYQEQCTLCHGDFGEGTGRWPPLSGGEDSLTDDRPVKTVGSYWPYAPILFDYIRRAMPFGRGLSLSDDQTWALTAYVLFLNDLVEEDTVIDRTTLPAIEMPNRAGFIRVEDRKPDVSGVHCMKNCADGPARITSDQSKGPDLTR
jgi:cytochrome c